MRDKYIRIFTQILKGLGLGLICGFFGLIFGIFIGANLGFPSFGGNSGYESGSIFFAIVGIVIGALLGAIGFKGLFRNNRKYLVPQIVALALVFINVIIFDYYMPESFFLVILFLPIITITVIINWEVLSRRFKILIIGLAVLLTGFYCFIVFVQQPYLSGSRFICDFPPYKDIVVGQNKSRVIDILGMAGKEIVKKNEEENLFYQGDKERLIKEGWKYYYWDLDGGTTEIYFDENGLVIGKNCGKG